MKNIVSCLMCAVLGLALAAPVSVAAEEISASDLDQLLKKLADVKDQIAALRDELKQLPPSQPAAPAGNTPETSCSGIGENIRLGGEAAAGLFNTGREGASPNNEFRIDEAKLFLDAKVLDNVFFFSEFDLKLREAWDDDMRVGELYLEIEDLQSLWDGESPLALRAGRMDIPFGEEYLTRDAIDNPFVSHTLADVWGVDEGIEIFGKLSWLDFATAVQNGSYLRTSDGNQDKSVAARIGAGSAQGFRVSASAMRTGDLSVQRDELGEVWFGNMYLTPVGSSETTTKFYASLGQIDAIWNWGCGHTAATLGEIRYDDNDSTVDNQRDAAYWSVELVQDLVRKFYAGVRYSQIQAADGFMVAGNASQSGDYADLEVESIWRISAVAGWRWNEHLALKAEYTWERGDRPNGTHIEGRDLVAAQICCGF